MTSPALVSARAVRGAALPPGQIHAADFVRPYFNKSLDWFHRHRKGLEQGYGFPAPIPPGATLIYYVAEIEAWFAGRIERARRAAVAQRLNIAIERVEPDWDALRRTADRRL